MKNIYFLVDWSTLGEMKIKMNIGGGGGVGEQGPDEVGSAGGMRPRMGVGVCWGQNGGQSAHRHK